LNKFIFTTKRKVVKYMYFQSRHERIKTGLTGIKGYCGKWTPLLVWLLFLAQGCWLAFNPVHVCVCETMNS